MPELMAKFINMGFGIWNWATAFVIHCVAESPFTYADGGVWKIVEKVMPVFTGIGCSLVAVFFLAGWFMESISIKDDMRVENIIRLIIRLVIAETLVVYNVPLISALFKMAGALTRFIGGTQGGILSITDAQMEVIKSLDFFEGLGIALIELFLFLVICICSFFIIYTAYFRILKIFIIIPYGAITLATMAGTGRITDTAVSYIKNLFAVVLEGVSIALIILICNAFVMGGIQDELASNMLQGSWKEGEVMLSLMLSIFPICITTGAIKGAQALTAKLIGA